MDPPHCKESKDLHRRVKSLERELADAMKRLGREKSHSDRYRKKLNYLWGGEYDRCGSCGHIWEYCDDVPLKSCRNRCGCSACEKCSDNGYLESCFGYCGYSCRNCSESWGRCACKTYIICPDCEVAGNCGAPHTCYCSKTSFCDDPGCQKGCRRCYCEATIYCPKCPTVECYCEMTIFCPECPIVKCACGEGAVAECCAETGHSVEKCGTLVPE